MPKTAKSALSRKLTEIYRILYGLYGEVKCPLHHETPFQLLVATILSAQCTDQRVNLVTADLFAKWPDAASIAAAEAVEVEPYIKTAGLFRAKAANIVKTARKICEDFNGEVPSTMEDLTKLPGVGRKTANVLLGNAFEIPGFPVDTHVQRLTQRLGLVDTDDPVKIEKIITAAIAPEYWTNFSHLLILHGRRVCRARGPLCEECPLLKLCPFGQLEK